jgi:hypothetical protein
MAYEISAGWDPTRPMTQKQKSSPRFEWEPRVLGKVLYRGHKLVMSDTDYEVNRKYLSVLADEDVILIKKVGADEPSKPAETVEVAPAPTAEVLPADAAGSAGDPPAGEGSPPVGAVAEELPQEVQEEIKEIAAQVAAASDEAIVEESKKAVEQIETKLGRKGRRA